MPSYGQIRKGVQQQRSTSSILEAELHAAHWLSSLEAFESMVPSGRFEQIQWLRALGKVGSEFSPAKSAQEAKSRRQLRELCRFAMLALYAGLPEAACGIRNLAQVAPVLVPNRVSAHFIAERLLESLRPAIVAANLDEP